MIGAGKTSSHNAKIGMGSAPEAVLEVGRHWPARQTGGLHHPGDDRRIGRLTVEYKSRDRRGHDIVFEKLHHQQPSKTHIILSGGITAYHGTTIAVLTLEPQT